jgi:Protein of unknown function (DUF732)
MIAALAALPVANTLAAGTAHADDAQSAYLIQLFKAHGVSWTTPEHVERWGLSVCDDLARGATVYQVAESSLPNNPNDSMSVEIQAVLDAHTVYCPSTPLK